MVETCLEMVSKLLLRSSYDAIICDISEESGDAGGITEVSFILYILML